MTTTAEIRHQVFVSSTYIDLVEERRAVIEALLELDCIPAGMEMFPAANDDQWTLIRGVIDQSDYYVVIVGGRYGSVSAEGISFTEMEYDYAVEKGIPVLGFVHATPDQIPAGRSDLDPAAREKLETFRAKVKLRMVKTYQSPDELASVVSRGLIRTMKSYPRPGWIRGDQAMTADVRAQIAELRAALAEKERTELVETVATAQLDDSFEHGADVVVLMFDIQSASSRSTVRQVSVEYSWDDILALLGPSMIGEAAEPGLRSAISQDATPAVAKQTADWGSIPRATLKIDDNSWGLIVVQLRAIGIIATGTKNRTASDNATYWRLTQGGDTYLVRLKASKRARMQST